MHNQRASPLIEVVVQITVIAEVQTVYLKYRLTLRQPANARIVTEFAKSGAAENTATARFLMHLLRYQQANAQENNFLTS